MTTVGDLCDHLEAFAPARLAEEWDNVGLLVGRREATIQRVMTCLTITPISAAEAISHRADLIVAHHPLPFRALKRLTDDSTVGRMLLDLIGSQTAIYSPHTAFDSTAGGINQQLAEGLPLREIRPLVAIAGEPEHVGVGRYGRFEQPIPLREIEQRLMKLLGIDRLEGAGPAEREVSSAAVACGSAGQFLDAARQAGCDLLITGETNFHTCLEAEASGVSLLLPGHFASERFAVERLAESLQREFGDLSVWASRTEADPIRSIC
ncbi:MAG: Nif3-like dinuclear metal center hexameric protein [Pirellulaceae bacterium]